MQTDYTDVSNRIASLCEGETDEIALMATIAGELFHSDPRFDWVGFYRNVGNETLKIGPYQGGHGCLTIPFSRGVCGAAARTGEIQIVADVNTFEGHIACASSTQSEIVLPVWNADGYLIAVFDVDSDQPNAFTGSDAKALSEILSSHFGQHL